MNYGIYQHYKGGMYRIVGVFRHADTQQAFVAYTSLKDGKHWTLPMMEWATRKNLDGRMVSRFEFVGHEPKDGPEQTAVEFVESLAAPHNDDKELLDFLCESGYHCVPTGPGKWGIFTRKWELITEGADYRRVIRYVLEVERMQREAEDADVNCPF